MDEWLAPGGGAPTEELAELNNVPVSRRDIATLRPGEWLNDEVINFYMELLKQRASADMSLGDGKRFPKCHIFRTMFYPKLMQNATFDYSRVRRWTMAKKMAHGDVFGMDLVLVPIHCNGNHWTLAVINFVDKRFEYHDSLRGSGRHVIKNLRDWLRKESADKRKCEWEGWEEIAGHPNDGEWRNGWRRRSGSAGSRSSATASTAASSCARTPTTTRATASSTSRRPTSTTSAAASCWRSATAR